MSNWQSIKSKGFQNLLLINYVQLTHHCARKLYPKIVYLKNYCLECTINTEFKFLICPGGLKNNFVLVPI